jgi:hypothetical protein
MTRRALSRVARGLVVAGSVLVVAGLYPQAWADLDNGSLLLVGLLLAYLAVSLRTRRTAAAA